MSTFKNIIGFIQWFMSLGAQKGAPSNCMKWETDRQKGTGTKKLQQQTVSWFLQDHLSRREQGSSKQITSLSADWESLDGLV